MPEENNCILVNNNQIWFEGEITSNSVHRLMFEIAKQPSKVDLFVCSGGGCVQSGLSFVDFLNVNQKKVTLIGHGYLHSAASYWLFSKCKTYLFPSTEVMFHPMTHYLEDRSEALEGKIIVKDSLTRFINNLQNSKGFSCDWENKTFYFYADEFVRRGIVDGYWEG
jgi:ATP-dependent protease ClpP protease subunit